MGLKPRGLKEVEEIDEVEGVDAEEPQREVPLGELRSYRGPWKGELVLACGKCQRKMKGGKVGNLKKSLKKISRAEGEGLVIKVLKVPCLKMCPKGGVAVCFGAQLQRSECSIVRTEEDLETISRVLQQQRNARGR